MLSLYVIAVSLVIMVGRVRNMSELCEICGFRTHLFGGRSKKRSSNVESNSVRKLGTPVPTLWGKNYSFLLLG